MNKKIYLNKIKKNWKEINNIPNELLNDKSFLIEAVKINGTIIHGINSKYLDDEDIIIAASKTYLYAACYASDRIKENEKLVLKMIKNNCFTITFFPFFLKNKKFILKAIKQNYLCYKLLNQELKNDEEVKEKYEKVVNSKNT